METTMSPTDKTLIDTSLQQTHSENSSDPVQFGASLGKEKAAEDTAEDRINQLEKEVATWKAALEAERKQADELREENRMLRSNSGPSMGTSCQECHIPRRHQEDVLREYFSMSVLAVKMAAGDRCQVTDVAEDLFAEATGAHVPMEQWHAWLGVRLGVST